MSNNKLPPMAAITLAAWLETKSPGESGVSFTFSPEEVNLVPEGYYGVVRMELRKVGGEPKEYETCGYCGTMHIKGTECPYKTKEEKRDAAG